jgi:hypothetical protein
MAADLNGNTPGRCCADFLCLFPQLTTLTPQHKCLMRDLMVHTVCSNEVNDGQQMCFLWDSGVNEDEEAEDEVQSPYVVEQARLSLELAIERARATKRPLEAVEGNGDLADTAAMTKAVYLSLAIAPESMVTPIMKKKRK